MLLKPRIHKEKFSLLCILAKNMIFVSFSLQWKKIMVFVALFLSLFIIAAEHKTFVESTSAEVFVFVSQCSTDVYRKFDWSLITTVVYFSNPGKEFIDFAHSKNASVLKLASGITKAVLINSTARQNWVDNELKEIKMQHLDGINIDYELPVDAKSTEQIGLTKLVQQTWAKLKNANPMYKVTFDVAWSPDCIDGRCYDIKTMSYYLDLIFVMAYDERSQIKLGPCVAGANSGFYQTISGLSKYINMGISPSKLVLGVPWYGRNYPCETFDEKTNTCFIEKIPFRGVNCSDSPGTEYDYSYLSNLMDRKGIKPTWDNITQTPFFNYQESAGKYHQVWFDSPLSLEKKLNLVKKYSLRGAGMWNAVQLDNSDTERARKMREQFWNLFRFD